MTDWKETIKGNTALLLYQSVVTGFVMVKAMSDTSALCVAQAFEECVYRRFGAPSLVRHDQDPRFMSEIFQAFAKMTQSRSRATLSYRPQANGELERSVKTVMQSVQVYAEDPLQQDWDEIVKRLVYAIYNSQDTTWKETSLYLVHGCPIDTQSDGVLLETRDGRQSDTLVWTREVNRQQEIAQKMAKEYQAVEKARRASEHNISLSRFYPVVHVSQLKAVKEFGDRPKVRLTREFTDEARLDFDDALLPEDSWEPDMLVGEYEVESILNDGRPMETSTRRSVREFLVKWVGYDEPTWEPMTNLSCGGLLYDYMREKRSSRRFQMVQVADED
ncbi:unnamed protein product [Phytophthora fragariaefolia]|uniref:Unnamed protein product n=1 Tax=Phytophthora fragariaefolia TaxID=1490495 RepID=A0A9W7D598_9STRA|nr:unnamed protein product [Phytophthora fragariaefolia]